jgi:hypothetical protein
MLYNYEAQRTSANPSKSPILIKQRMAKEVKLQYSTYQSQGSKRYFQSTSLFTMIFCPSRECVKHIFTTEDEVVKKLEEVMML